MPLFDLQKEDMECYFSDFGEEVTILNGVSEVVTVCIPKISTNREFSVMEDSITIKSEIYVDRSSLIVYANKQYKVIQVSADDGYTKIVYVNEA